jgi:hypothetical protein
MDLHDRDELRMRRQETLARRIGQALDEMDARNAEHCPEGEILATYAEQGLSEPDTEKWESHFATCSRCRKILQVLAVSEDSSLAEKEVARLGEMVAASRASAQRRPAREAKDRAPWAILDWRRNWLAPAIGIAAVLIVWFAMRPPWRTAQHGAPENLIAQAPKEELPPSPAPPEGARPSGEAPPQDQKAEPAPPSKDETEATVRDERSLSEQRPQYAPAAPSGGFRKKSDDNRLSAEAQAKARLPAPQQVSPAAPPRASAMGGAAAPSAPAPSPAPPASTAQTVTVTEAAPMVDKTNGTLSSSLEPRTRADLPVNGRNFESLARVQGAPVNGILLKAPASSVVWRAGKGGSIERSADGGMTWVSQTSPSQQDWLAGAVLSDKVCWVAGRKGAIARTVDGERWELIPPPAQAAGAGAVQPDWTGVTALDALNATVTAADGRKFNTPDGGLTWQQE